MKAGWTSPIRWASILADEPGRHPAGRVFHYSNPGSALLGALVGGLRGQPWHEVLRRELLAPLGMARTILAPRPPHARGFAVHPWADVMRPAPAESTGLMAPAGELWSTPADLCRFAAFLLFRRDGRVLFGHGGSMPGFLATLCVSPADGVGAIALANATSGPDIGAIAIDLAMIVADSEPRLPARWKPLPEADQALLPLTGLWYWGPRPYALRLLAGGPWSWRRYPAMAAVR